MRMAMKQSLGLAMALAWTKPVYAQNIFGAGGCIQTAIGCIDPTPSGLFTKFFSIGIGIAGGIAFLLIVFGGFQIITSAGNPERLNEGKEVVTSAIAGLLMIIFSVFLLKIIGVNILGLPGFS
jgi:hypothetical protein